MKNKIHLIQVKKNRKETKFGSIQREKHTCMFVWKEAKNFERLSLFKA